jgi:hypothetical protein
MAYLLKSYDVSMTKDWSRQNVEINIADNRGACRAYKRPMMLADDPWNGGAWCARSPDEMEQVWYLGYFSGVDYIYHEYLGFVQKGHEIFPNLWGERELNFGRFATVHPTRGGQVVKLAVMRGFGDDWSKIACEYTPGVWGYARNRRAGEDIADYNLLNVFFPGFGTSSYSDVYHLCTGTPFGPVDMIPWDTSLAHLKTFDVVVYLGLNAMDDSQYRTLKEYVKQGGTLVLTLGQLRTEGKEPRALLPAAVEDDLLGTRLDPVPAPMAGKTLLDFQGKPGTVNGFYPLTLATAKPLAATRDGRPVIVKNRCGKGTVYLYATDFISKVDEASNTRFLSELFAPAKLLDIAPPSDWIEYTISQKAGTYIVGMFNHGRLRFPSGNGPDHGVWRGKIKLSFDKFPGLRATKSEAYRVEFQDPELQLIPVQLVRDRAGVSVELAVDRRAELIIGPKGSARQEFLSSR